MRLILSVALFVSGVLSFLPFENYVNEFIDPSFILSGNFANTTGDAQQTIVEWADMLTAQGPWSVITSKPDGFNAPSGDPHDYLSWAPYWFPDCSKVGNTTELTPQEIWKQCPYVNRDGQFNPDRLLVNNTGAFSALSDAVLYNVLAWKITGSSKYSSDAVRFINTWFLDPATKMNPNLNYAQVIRGPGSDFGAHTGVLDLKCMAKIATGILTLRQGGSPDWTNDIESGMSAWITQYINWMETSPIALAEGDSANNHGSFYYNQLASLYLINQDKAGALNVTQWFFDHIYQNQIEASGEQPFEAARTHPYHYRGYNLAAVINNARLGHYSGLSNAWNISTQAGGGIQKALDFAIAQPAGEEPILEIHPYVAAVASIYGDPDGKYAAFLNSQNADYVTEAYFLWNQPLGDSGYSISHKSATSSSNHTSSSQPHSGSTMLHERSPLFISVAALLIGILF